MEFITKVIKHSSLAIMLAIIPITSHAQITVVDTSYPEEPLVEPTIIVPYKTPAPSCHTYTGCDVIAVEKYYYRIPKRKRSCGYRVKQPCCMTNYCNRPCARQCW